MASCRSLGALVSSPIAPVEFYRALTGLWATWEGGKHVPLQRIGLAVSGGSDSMALAYLCSRLVSLDFLPGLEVKAYVVDHKFRPESSQEARSVADRIEKLGIQSKVLTIPWPAGEPLTKKGFETQARMLRYQILGKACAADDIRALLLGHHQDDNVETALMRVSKGHRKLGLVGFDDIAPIPECHGLYGVSRSGSTTSLQDIFESTNMDGTVSYSPSRETAYKIKSTSGQMQISTGGVYLLRPFRSFSKPRLVATCRENNVPFVTDSTNEDLTFTIRNTVRQLLESEDLLPRALQRSSILSLVDKSREHTGKFRMLCDALLNKVEILNLDTRFGTMVVKLPEIFSLPKHQRKEIHEHNSLPEGVRDVYASVMRSLCDIISPYPDRWSPLSQFRNPACRAFLGFDPSGMNGAVFTVGGVLWQAIKQKSGRKCASKSLPSLSNLPGNLQVRNQEFTPLPGGQENIWLISRQPMHSGKAQPVVDFALKIPNYKVARTRGGVILQTEDNQDWRQNAGKFIHTEWADWKLWDNRYWIRIRGRASIQQHDRPQKGTEQDYKPWGKHRSMFSRYSPNSEIPIKLRALEPTDLIRIRKILGGAVKRSLYRDIAKGDLSRGEELEPHARSHLSSTLANYLTPQTISSPATTVSKNSTSTSPMTPSAFQKVLALLAPGKIRFSAPILTDAMPEKKEGGNLENLQEQLLGMPSLPMSLRTKIHVRTPVIDADEKGNVSTFDVPWSLEWEIRYKWIDPNTVRSVSWQSI